MGSRLLVSGIETHFFSRIANFRGFSFFPSLSLYRPQATGHSFRPTNIIFAFRLNLTSKQQNPIFGNYIFGQFYGCFSFFLPFFYCAVPRSSALCLLAIRRYLSLGRQSLAVSMVCDNQSLISLFRFFVVIVCLSKPIQRILVRILSMSGEFHSLVVVRLDSLSPKSSLLTRDVNA